MADIVVFDSQDDQGSNFSLSLPQSDDVIRLSAGVKFNDSGIEPGDCVYIRYVPVGHPAYTSGIIELYDIRPINNLKVEVGDDDSSFDGFSDDPISVTSAWPMLSHLILYTALPYSSEKRTLKLIIDKQTLDSEEPVAYLYHRLNGKQDNFYRNYYLAFNLSELREQYGFKSLLVTVADKDRGVGQFRIKFQNTIP